MRYLIMFLMTILIAMQFFTGCEKDSSSTSANTTNQGMGKLTIYLTDAPATVFDSINITFSEVSAHIDSEWVTVRGDSITVNLLELSNGDTLVFGSADVPAGRYTQIRIIIDDANVVVENERHPLTVPSGAQTGLKLGPQFTVNEGSTYELVVDFDVNRSIVIMGPPFNPRYKLKPHLRVVPMGITGSISGTVTNPEHVPTAYALQEADTITTSLVDTLSGLFRLSFLPSGVYTVEIEDTLGRAAELDSVDVVAGENQDLGEISLE